MSETRVKLREWSRLDPDSEAGVALRGLRLADGEPRALAARLAETRVLEVLELRDGVRIRTFSHVGRVRLGDLVVTVEPKIGRSDLLKLLRYAYGLRDLTVLGDATFATTGELLQDLLVMQLLAEVDELVRRGLSKRYVERTERLGSPQGRIDVDDLARRGPLRAAELRCRHHLRSADHTLNRVLLAGLRLAGDVAQDAALRRSVRRLAERISSEVSRVSLGQQILDEAHRRLDRLAYGYDSALCLVELLWACRAISLDEESTTELPGFLFDMNRFFQAVVTRFLGDHLPDFEVEAEHGIRDMMRYLPGSNPRGRRPPTPRPDIIVRRPGTTVVALLDAKYRDLWERELPREMLYQLAMYALSQPRAATAAILYPTLDAFAVDAVVEIRDPVREGALGFVALRPMILPALVEALTGADRAQDLARALAFGTPRPAPDARAPGLPRAAR